MCRVYQCFEVEWAEKAEDAAYDALDKMRAEPTRAGFYLEFIKEKAPHILTTISRTIIQDVLYQDHLDHRAHVANIHNKFRQGVKVAQLCPF